MTPIALNRQHLYFTAGFAIALTLGLLGCISHSADSLKVPKDFCETIHRNDAVTLSTELKSLEPLMAEKTGVYVLEDGGGSLVTRAWLCEYAEATIDIQYFIFSTDNVGLIACDYLVRAADRGVKVRMLVDDIMVDAGIEDVLAMDAHKNIEVKIYNPGVNLGKSIFSKVKKFATDFRSANQRMHNKTFTVDGKVVITGGRNIADEYFDYSHEYNFRDRDVLLLGKCVPQVTASFETFWADSLSVPVTDLVDNEDIPHEETFENLHQYACNPDNFWPGVRQKIETFTTTIDALKNSEQLVWVDDVYFVSDEPGKNDGSEGLGGGGISTSALVGLVQNAQVSIDIQTPYLITTDVGVELFKAAVNRGVRVRILTNSLASTDNLEAFAGYQKGRQALLETGVKIYEYKPDALIRRKIMTGELADSLDYSPIFGLHAKSMVVDGLISVVGTFNLDPRSANLNTECVAIINSEEVSKNILGVMEQEYLPENSWETTLTSNPDSTVGNVKRIKSWTRKILPKGIL